MDNRDTSNKIKPSLLREYEFFGGCIRVKISVKNTSSLAILDAALELESDEKVLHFDRCEPEYPEKKGKILLGNIHPNTDRTIAFYLDPLICAKEGTDINCRVSYKDASGRPDSVQMETLKIKVVCPIFRTEQDVNIGRLKELVSGLQFHDSKVYTIPKKVEISELLGTCRDVIQLHDVRHIKTFKTTDEKTYEAWYYGKTKVTKKDLVIKCAICKDTESIEVFAAGNDPSDITGLLAEIGRNLTKEFEKLGKVQPVFNIHIKDSIIQRSNLLSFCNLDGTCGGDVVIEDSVVRRSSIGSWNEGAQKEREEAQKREKEEQERLRRLKEQEERALREREAREDAERRESERQKARQEEERTAKEREKLSVSEKKAGISQIKFLAVALVLGVVLIGYFVLAPGANVSSTISPIPIAKPPPSTFNNSIGMEFVQMPVSMSKNFSYMPWGSYQGIDFNDEKYILEYSGGTTSFTGYPISMIANKQLHKILINDATQYAVYVGNTLTLNDGYVLKVKDVDIKGNKIALIQLLKDGKEVDLTAIEDGKTYIYSKKVGSVSDLPIIAVHIDSTFFGKEGNGAYIKGIFQISENYTITENIYGEFDMGSPSNETGRYDGEEPVHRVKISKGFYIGKYEVTQKQWRDVMGTNPSVFKGDELPVEEISWNEVQEFIKKLNDKEGTNKYRLPSEAEWEYSARAGTTTKFSFGDDESKLGEYGWYKENSGGSTHPVGEKKPNPWGLYDMHGNVWEWVQDIYHNSYNGAPSDGSAWENGDGFRRITRGGSWIFNAGFSRSAIRNNDDRSSRHNELGFRLVRDL